MINSLLYSYNRMSFSDDSGEHRLELGSFLVRNLTPNTPPIYEVRCLWMWHITFNVLGMMGCIVCCVASAGALWPQVTAVTCGQECQSQGVLQGQSQRWINVFKKVYYIHSIWEFLGKKKQYTDQINKTFSTQARHMYSAQTRQTRYTACDTFLENYVGWWVKEFFTQHNMYVR